MNACPLCLNTFMANFLHGQRQRSHFVPAWLCFLVLSLKVYWLISERFRLALATKYCRAKRRSNQTNRNWAAPQKSKSSASVCPRTGQGSRAVDCGGVHIILCRPGLWLTLLRISGTEFKKSLGMCCFSYFFKTDRQEVFAFECVQKCRRVIGKVNI